MKFENNELVLHTYGMAYGSTTRYFSFNEEGNSDLKNIKFSDNFKFLGQLVILQTIADVKGTRWFERENK